MASINIPNDYPYMDFDVKVSFTLEKECKVNTDDYLVEHDDFQKESWINTDFTDWETEYDNSHYTITEMLNELRKYIENEMRMVEPCSGRGRELKRMLEDCQGWELVESNYEKG